ncbi:MAG: ATP-dependent RecD-like DNA helicase [Lachnospiraceae bacterium]|nr:ATP-dependent RecD-like DNA helicase [Lachnospiraceae bacterium]
METIKGYVSSIRYRNPDNGYTVLSLQTDDAEETVVGNFLSVSEGEMLEVSGEWTIHPIYDKQLKMQTYKTVELTDRAAVLRYLSSGVVKGIGAALAERIVKEFGDDTFRVMEEEPELLERVKGISLNKAREIGIIMQEKKGYREAMIFLGKYGIGNTLSIKIYSEYGDRIYKIITENPYKLAEDISGVGFKTADEIAAKIGVKTDSEYRIKSGILYVLSLGLARGHMYLPKSELIRETVEMLGIGEDAISPEIDNLLMDSKILIKDDKVFAMMNYRTETATAGLLRTIAEYGDIVNEERTLKTINKIAEENDIFLDDLQQKAVLNAVTEGISIITGGPGTGKTTTIKAIIHYFEKEGLDFALAAPTGRAAKRMTEATGYEASTIHRLLELNGALTDSKDDAVFERNEDNPLEVDAIIIDEMSMVDIFLFKSLLSALPNGARLVLVGDADQLPSVGPGQVLKDLIESGVFKLTRLEKIYRQEGTGDIVLNAHRINKGEEIEANKGSKDFFFIERAEAEKVLLNTEELITKSLPPYTGVKPFDIQVLTPMRKGILGVISLNKYLQNALNPASSDKKEHMYGDNLFREGDKVMQIKNNYKATWEVLGKYDIPVDSGTGVFNGDMGRVIKINTVLSEVEVEFDDKRRVTYPFANLDELELAYAITIHKSQGSEYDTVIIPILSGPKQLLNRNLLYTGVTRAKKCLCLLGSRVTVREMISNNCENLRYTGLKARILEAFHN